MWERATRPLGFCINLNSSQLIRIPLLYPDSYHPATHPPATHHPDSYQGMPSGIPQMPQH
jgi:hypothetical protein